MENRVYVENFSIEELPIAVIVVDVQNDYNIVKANEKFYSLIGFSEEESQLNGGDFKEILYENAFKEESIDIITPTEIMDALVEHISIENKCCFDTQIIHKNNGNIWVNMSGEKIGNFLYVFVVDISQRIAVMDQMEGQHEYVNLVMSLTDDLFFDYNFTNDSIRISSKFTEKFGLPEIIENALPVLSKKIKLTDAGKEVLKSLQPKHGTNEVSEIEIIAPNGEVIWYSIRYNISCDKMGKPVRVVGRMSDITNKIEHIANLREKAEKDPLTKLYNKEESRLKIEETIADRRGFGAKAKHALIIMDVDNFKGVNDTLGHQFGDKVLVDVANKIRNVFRDTDILGRLGGDEFVILMRSIEQMSLVEAKCKLLNRMIKKTFNGVDSDVTISASIGVCIFPKDGKKFSDLYNFADTALYVSKKRGKDTYTIYDAKTMKDKDEIAKSIFK